MVGLSQKDWASLSEQHLLPVEGKENFRCVAGTAYWSNGSTERVESARQVGMAIVFE